MSVEWSASSLRQQQQHQAVLHTLEAQRLGQTIVVPTLAPQVRDALRQLGLPVRLFGENLANIRDRLRMELALRQTSNQQRIQEPGAEPKTATQRHIEDDETVTKYTRASAALVEARNEIAQFSLERARTRLDRERSLRVKAKKRKMTPVDEKLLSMHSTTGEDFSTLVKMDRYAAKTIKQLKNLALEGSQYCDHRALSAVKAASVEGTPLVVTVSWTASLHILTQGLQGLTSRSHCHEDRIMGLDAVAVSTNETLLATASLDKTGKLFKVRSNDGFASDADATSHSGAPSERERVEKVNGGSTQPMVIEELGHLQGHAARLCRVTFHPLNKHVASTSFDHTWRLWDVETSECLLLQDGHAMECYGIGFHGDGSLVSTSDLGGIVHLWDLRVGKSIAWYRSHAGKVLNTEFHPNGFQMATAGEDGCIHIWDLRRRVKSQRANNPQQTSSPMFSIPAHNSVITRLKFAACGEFLCSSSFDGLVKLWNCRSWKSINPLQGHEGKVTCVDVTEGNGIVTSGFDKTVKLWR